MKPTENEANAASAPVTGSKVGKKTSLKIRAAAVPKMKKSYHSIVVPMRLAKATLRDERNNRPSLDSCAVSRWLIASDISRRAPQGTRPALGDEANSGVIGGPHAAAIA